MGGFAGDQERVAIAGGRRQGRAREEEQGWRGEERETNRKKIIIIEIL